MSHKTEAASQKLSECAETIRENLSQFTPFEKSLAEAILHLLEESNVGTQDAEVIAEPPSPEGWGEPQQFEGEWEWSIMTFLRSLGYSFEGLGYLSLQTHGKNLVRAITFKYKFDPSYVAGPAHTPYLKKR